MNELRWILLAAGVLLIAGVYFWGVRSRARVSAGQGARRPAVFTGGHDSFESSEEPVEPADSDGRVEPSVSLDDSGPGSARAEGRRIDFDDDHEAVAVTSPAGRREPTFSGRAETAPAGRPEPPLATRPAGSASPRIEPRMAASGADTAAAPEPAPPPAKPRPAQKIMAVRVSANAGARFAGQDLLEILRDEGLAFGRYDIFHRLHADGRPIFSVASLREPGTFDLPLMPETDYPGIALFTVLPGPLPATDAIDTLLLAARTLAERLGGQLADERGVPLTALRAGRLREEALEFERAAGPA